MDKAKSDRRVKYTKKMLKSALVQLLSGKHISAITVKELCEQADINRSTFYAHYSDPQDLLSQIEAEVYENVKNDIKKHKYVQGAMPVSAQTLTSILAYARENVDLWKALLSENCNFAFQKDILDLSHIVTAQYDMGVDRNAMEYIRAFSTAGTVSLLQKWLKDGAVESPEYMSALALELLQYRPLRVSNTAADQ